MKTSAVLFDLDGTLIDHESAVGDALRAWLPTLGVRPTAAVVELWHEVQERHLVAWRERAISFAEQRRRRLREFLPAVGVPFEEPALDAIFQGYLRSYEDAWRPFDDVGETLAALAVPVAILTNGDRGQQLDKVRRTGLAGRFEAVWTPSDLGVAKPDPAAFRLVCERWGKDPAGVLSVGDRADLDVVPARAAGLRAVRIDRRDPGPGDLRSLRRLPELLT